MGQLFLEKVGEGPPRGGRGEWIKIVSLGARSGTKRLSGKVRLKQPTMSGKTLECTTVAHYSHKKIWCNKKRRKIENTVMYSSVNRRWCDKFCAYYICHHRREKKMV